VGRLCGQHGEKINSYRILVGKPEVKKHLEDVGVKERAVLMELKEI
jgi:hypothetical protein